MRFAKSVITLAVVCLLAVPALSMPNSGGKADRTGGMNNCEMDQPQMGRGCGGAFLLMGDLTEEEMQSMTLAELKELREQKMNELQNMTAEEIEALREEKRAEMENMTIAELREQRQDRFDRPFIGGGACLLVTDLTSEELEGMTLAEIEALKQEKIDELNNMTLAEIEALNEEKKAEMENMTLAELKEQMEVCSLLGLGGFGKDHRMGGHGCQGGQFGMVGSDGCGFNCGRGIQQNQCEMAGAGMQQGRGDYQMNGPDFGGQR
jgi:hypothetical protein